MDKIKNRQAHPFFMLPNTLIDGGHLACMGSASAMVYLCLCRHANTEHQCFPSYSKLQEETGMARATTSKAIANLIELGYIRKLTLRHGQANIYEIMELPDPDQFKKHTSSEIELVQKLNCTSSEIELPLVQKLNSKNTNRKRPIEKNTGERPAQKTEGDRQPEFFFDELREEQLNAVNQNNLLTEPAPKEGSVPLRGVPMTAKRSRDLGGLVGGRTDHQAIAAKSISLFKSVEEKESFKEWVATELQKDYSVAIALDKAGWCVRNLDSNKTDDLLAVELLKRYRARDSKNRQQGQSNDPIEGLTVLAKTNPSEAQKRANEIEASKGLPPNWIWNKVLGGL